MLRTGVDIVEINRIKKAIFSNYGKRFLKRIYTPKELELYGKNIPELAVRWAAKEAMAKALGRGLRGLSGASPLTWKEIEVLPDQYGKPKIYLSGISKKLVEQIGIQEIDISLSHTHNLAIAFVVCSWNKN